MAHVQYWPERLNFPYETPAIGEEGEVPFWTEVGGCLECRAEFYDRFRDSNPEILEDEFWEEVELYLDEIHPQLPHMAAYLHTEVELILSKDKSGREEYDKNFFHLWCHLLICSRCAQRFAEVQDRKGKVNQKIKTILKPFP